jgi:stress-induced morphogen
LKKIVKVLERYTAKHPSAEVEAYRQNSASVRVRVVDPAFQGMSRTQREEDFWFLFEDLPDELAAELSVVLLLTPDEAKKSLANIEFDDPTPSKL